MPTWHAINHGMTAISTGVFSIIDGSIGAYDNAMIEIVLLPIRITGGIALPIHYLVLQGDLLRFELFVERSRVDDLDATERTRIEEVLITRDDLTSSTA